MNNLRQPVRLHGAQTATFAGHSPPQDTFEAEGTLLSKFEQSPEFETVLRQTVRLAVRALQQLDGR